MTLRGTSLSKTPLPDQGEAGAASRRRVRVVGGLDRSRYCVESSKKIDLTPNPFPHRKGGPVALSTNCLQSSPVRGQKEAVALFNDTASAGAGRALVSMLTNSQSLVII